MIFSKNERFFSLLDAQAVYNVQAAETFHRLATQWSRDSAAFEHLHDIEHEADITTHEIVGQLRRTLATPFDREDIHALADCLDDVVDLVEGIAARMRLYRVDQTTAELTRLTRILLQATEEVCLAISALRHPKQHPKVRNHCIEIKRLEGEGDCALAGSLAQLFSQKPDALHAMKWMEIYEGTEAAIDKCADVANAIESMLVKQG